MRAQEAGVSIRNNAFMNLLSALADPNSEVKRENLRYLKLDDISLQSLGNIKDLNSIVDKPIELSSETKQKLGLYTKEVKLSDIIARIKRMKK